MENVILVVHILTCIAMIGVVLLQRSEGGALGMGGGGGGGLVSGRGAASVLTRTTMILAAVFFVTSLVLTTMATRGAQSALGLGEEIISFMCVAATTLSRAAFGRAVPMLSLLLLQLRHNANGILRSTIH